MVTSPTMVDWGEAEILGEGGELLLYRLRMYQRSYKKLQKAWKEATGEDLE